MAKYVLSIEAELDLFEIAAFGFETFGTVHAHRYRDELKAHVEHIANNPLAYPDVGHIHQNSRRSVFKSHAIYYQIMNESILILRILGRQDPTKAFE